MCIRDRDTSIRDLAVFSDRYAEVIHRGLAEAKPMRGSGISAARTISPIPQTPPDRKEIADAIRETEQWLCTEEAEADLRLKNGKVADLVGWRKVLSILDKMPHPVREVDLMGIRFGDITLVSNPFELFNGIKNQVQDNLASRCVLVLGYANDYIGYAPVASEYEKDGKKTPSCSYAAYQVPRFIGEPPFGPHLEQRLVDEMTALARQVNDA